MAVPTDAALRTLLDQFVCVRMVQMHGIDLSRFQFDYAMTWSVFFMNADGTIYGRYGTRSAMRQQSARDISLSGFKRSIEAALQFHTRYREDPKAAGLAVRGKQTPPGHAPKWNRPEEIPSLAKNQLLAKKFAGHPEQRNLRAHGVGCIHCHFVPNHELMSLRLAGEPIAARLIWPYPQPGAVGMHLDRDHRATVQRVVPETAAARAGLEADDEILTFGGQPVFSPADVQWVLHHATAPVDLSLSVRRAGVIKTLKMNLDANWRRHLSNWRFTNVNVCMQVAGFQGRPGPGGGKRLAIRVGRVHPKRLAGVDLRKNDIIVAIDGDRAPLNLGQLTEYLLAKKPGSEIAVTRRRPQEDAEQTVRFKIN